jgi:hypothetical protein
MNTHFDARRAGSALVLAAAATGALAAGTADAATVPAKVAVSQACYVLVGKLAPPVTIAGSGFPPSTQIDISDHVGLDTTAMTDPLGNFSVVEKAPNPFLAAPGQKKDVITAVGFDTSGNQFKGTVSTFLSQFGAEFSGSKAKPGLGALEERIKWAFSGFPVGARIWGHYTFGGKVVATQSFGKATAPCGVLKVSKRAFPGRPRHRRYKLQLDTKKTYSKKTEPAFRTPFGLTSAF